MKTRICSLLAVFCLLVSLCVIPASAAGTNVVYPHNGEELEAALASNTTIILEGKDYNIESDLYLESLENVTIQGTTGTRIICDSGSDTIIYTGDCKNIVLRNLVMGHNEYLTWNNLDACWAGVAHFYHSDVLLDNCDLFGCGLYGIEMSSSAVSMVNSTIRDCSDKIMELGNGAMIFQNCIFSGNGYSYNPDEDAIACSPFGDYLTLNFSGCTFLNNSNPNFITTTNNPECIKVTMDNCTFSGNGWGSTPQLPVAPDAIPTTSTVLINGVPATFDAYNIEGSNYFKLRDLAYALNGSAKQFSVDWDAATNSISMTSGAPYTPVGGEMSAGTGMVQKPAPASATLLVNGSTRSFRAFNIGGNNYFMLRSIASIFDFHVDWDEATSTISIDTTRSYYS